jgi:head-tail adaptor
MMMERGLPPQKTLATRARHALWLQVKQSVADGEGGYSEGWVNVQQVFASVEPIMASQRNLNASVNVDATHRVYMRGYISMTEGNRFLFGSRTLEILTIENLQERDFCYVVTCKERRYNG